MSCYPTNHFAKLGQNQLQKQGNFANKFNKSIRRFPLQKPQTPTLLGKINGISGLITGQPIENTSDFAGSFAELFFLAYQHPQE